VTAKVIQALNSWQKRSFKYGESDCCKFAAHVLTEITGRDYIARFDYHNEKDAFELIEQHGSLAGLVSHALGVKSGTNYIDGDPVMVRLPIIGDAMGVKLGNYAVCLTKKGLTKVNQNHIIEGWPICHQ
tara:strand:+ start:1432 stop:1818 length:387 start_codon:yes stop_codon:yes gene_type:complete